MSDQPQHLVKSYEAELAHLRDLVIQMGGLAESQVALAAEALEDKDTDAAAAVVEQDPKLDALEHEIEQFVIRLLALRQPVAEDLRLIVASMKVTGDLERIGDYAANVGKRAIVLLQFPLPFSLTGIGNMARLVQESLRNTIDAIGERDAAKLVEVWRNDVDVDDLYNALFRELMTYMMEDPRNITPCAHLLFIAKNMERIGDHATNIAETMYYAITGDSLPDARPKGDNTAYTVVRPSV
jgi:phosphate transport system protein